MKKIVVTDSYSFLYFNEQFYLKKNLKECAKEYEEFVTVSLKKLGNYHVVKLEPKDSSYSLSKISHEFLNFVMAKEYEVRT